MKKGTKAMRKELEQALEQVRQGGTAKAEQAAVRIKALPRDQEGVFDLSGLEGAAELGRVLYPVYAAYETQCNKKEGYPDILHQMRVMDARLQEHYDMQAAAVYMDTAFHTLMYISQEIYEYYREIMDLYKKNVHRFIREFYGEDGRHPQNAAAEALFQESLRQACREHILLEDKYERYC